MARSPLVLETHGVIRRKKVNGVPTAFTRYRDADGVTRKVQRTGKTLPDAEQNLKEALKSRIVEVDENAALTVDSTVMQLVDEWLSEARASSRYAVATLRTYDRRANALIKPALGSVRIREVTVSKIDRFIKLTIVNHGPGSARTIRSVLINAFDLATRHNLVDFNLAKNTAPVPTTRTTPDAPDVQTVKGLMAHLASHDEQLRAAGRVPYLRDLTMLYTATGARTSEILALTWPNIHASESETRVSIEATLVVNEEGKLERQAFTKTQAGMRRLLVPRAAADMLHDRRIHAYNEIVFPSGSHTFRWPHNLRRDWREALKGTKFEGITPKSFRKAVATLLRDEMGIEAARDQLGHSDERVTKSHYAQRVMDAPDATVALGKFFESAE